MTNGAGNRPSPPFGGEREGPSAERWEGEVGIGNRSGIPHLTPTLSAPRGGKGTIWRQPSKLRVREATEGRGADLILDPIGGKGFARNFAMLAPLGLVISYGRLDGPPDPGFVHAMRDNHAVSPAVRFFTIHSFDDRPEIRTAATRALLDHLAAGRIRPLIHTSLPLADAPRAHQLLESGEVIGKILMKP